MPLIMKNDMNELHVLVCGRNYDFFFYYFKFSHFFNFFFFFFSSFFYYAEKMKMKMKFMIDDRL